jgi:undecaprenyl-diphosphatase
MTQVDQSVLDWVLVHRSPALTDAFMLITTSGNTAVMTSLAVVLVAVLWVRHRRVDALAAASAMALAWIVMNGVKYATRRTRPPEPERIVDISTYSFPSGHALISAAFVTVVFVLVLNSGARRATVVVAGLVLGLVTVAVGVSRIYLAAHWFSDVIAGWAFGVAVAVLAMTVVRRSIAERLPLSDRAAR